MLPGGYQMLPGGDLALQGVTSYSIFAQWVWHENCFGVAGRARKVFRCTGDVKKSVLV